MTLYATEDFNAYGFTPNYTREMVDDEERDYIRENGPFTDEQYDELIAWYNQTDLNNTLDYAESLVNEINTELVFHRVKIDYDPARYKYDGGFIVYVEGYPEGNFENFTRESQEHLITNIYFRLVRGEEPPASKKATLRAMAAYNKEIQKIQDWLPQLELYNMEVVEYATGPNSYGSMKSKPKKKRFSLRRKKR